MENSENNIFEQYAELVRRMKAGDEFAFNELFDKTKKLVYATCYGILNNQQDAEEAMMDTYLAVSQNIGTLEDDNTFLKWLKTIAANKSRDKLKARKGDLSYDDAVETGEDLEGDDDLETLPDSYVMDKTKRDALMKILRESLSDVQFQTILLHYYDELSYEDIAGIMGCPKETVKSRLKLSRKIIKDRVTEYEKANMDKLMGGAASAPFLGRFFNAFADDLTIPKINPFPTKSTANPKGDIVKHGTAKATSKSFTEKAVFDAGAKATLAGASGVKMTLIAVSVLLGIGVIGGAIYGISRLAGNNDTEETEIEETEETALVVDASVIDYNGHSYALFDIGSSWEEAEAYCESVGGHLAVISTQEENDVIHAYAQSRGCDNVYIGYSDASNEGNWEWVNGESSSFTNWNEDEPNAYTPDENYAVMSQNGCWNDCAYTPFVENGNIIYVCEWECIVVANENLDGMEILAAMPEATEPSETEVESLEEIVNRAYISTLSEYDARIYAYENVSDYLIEHNGPIPSINYMDINSDGVNELMFNYMDGDSLHIAIYGFSEETQSAQLLMDRELANFYYYAWGEAVVLDNGNILCMGGDAEQAYYEEYMQEYSLDGAEGALVDEWWMWSYDYGMTPDGAQHGNDVLSASDYNSAYQNFAGRIVCPATPFGQRFQSSDYSFSVLYDVSNMGLPNSVFEQGNYYHLDDFMDMLGGDNSGLSSGSSLGQVLHSGDRIDVGDDYYNDYMAYSYSFASDGLSGDFFLGIIQFLTQEDVNSLSAGDSLPNGETVNSISMIEDGLYEVNGYIHLVRQENGYYYIEENEGYYSMPYGEYEFSISPDVIIVDNTSPFNPEGIIFGDNSYQIGSIQEFVSILQDPNTIDSQPNLFVRMVGTEIRLIVINPFQHEGWRN